MVSVRYLGFFLIDFSVIKTKVGIYVESTEIAAQAGSRMKYNNNIYIFFFWRDVLRLLLENLSDEVGSTRAMVFGALTEMLKQESLIVSFQGFTELIILKVLEAHRDEEKDVS